MLAKKLWFWKWILVLVCLAGAPAARAQEELPKRVWGEAEKVRGLAVIDRSAVRPGEAFRLAIDLEIEAGWHIYGNPLGPGVGSPTLATVQAPEGITFGPARYGQPHRLEQPELGPDQWVWAYETTARIYFEGRVAPDASPGDRSVRLSVECLACLESCVPDAVALTASVKVVGPGVATQATFARLFDGFDASAPAEAEAEPVVEPSPTAGTGAAPGAVESLDPSTEQAIQAYEPRVTDSERSLLLWILFGFLAGMILNVMPCVLPVISIKILSLVQQAKEERKTVFLHGLVFSAGILSVFLILAAAAAFAGNSWGEQFQSATFLVAMIVVIFLFSLGLFDIYSIELPGFVSRRGGQAREGLAGSFTKGMLATVLATPCSGPLLGAVLAYALSQSWLVVFVIFTSIGLGMAIPYVILTACPAFLRFVPKPGPWMVRFKELMGFLLLATVVYLLGIVSDDLRIWVITLCLILGLAAWIFGRVTGPERSAGHRWFWRSAAVVLALALGYWTYDLLVVPSRLLDKEPFSFARLEQLGREGRTVMVDWTADWCPNCKYVEKTVLESEEVRAALEKKRVVFMVADITRRRPVEEALMKRLGGAAIPFLGVFPGDNSRRPFTLRDIYSRADVMEILAQCPDPVRTAGSPSPGASVPIGR